MSKPLMKTIPVREAVGTILCHDITRIVPGVSKGPVFRKGHVVREEDIPVLLEVGKEHLYVFEPGDGLVHENDAAERIVAVAAGQNLDKTAPKEGRIDLKAACDGLLRVDVPTLTQVNSLGEITFVTLHTMQFVKKGRSVAGTRVVPLVIEDEKLKQMEALVKSPLIEVLPLAPAKVGVVTTGSEVYEGRIQDGFGPVLTRKFAELGCSVLGQAITNDEEAMTAEAVRAFIDQGADMVVVTDALRKLSGVQLALNLRLLVLTCVRAEKSVTLLRV